MGAASGNTGWMAASRPASRYQALRARRTTRLRACTSWPAWSATTRCWVRRKRAAPSGRMRGCGRPSGLPAMRSSSMSGHSTKRSGRWPRSRDSSFARSTGQSCGRWRRAQLRLPRQSGQRARLRSGCTKSHGSRWIQRAPTIPTPAAYWRTRGGS